MKKILLLMLIIILMFPSLIMATDIHPIAKLLFESAIEIDRRQSYNWHFATKENPTISPNGYLIYEVNPFVAGSTRDEFDKYNDNIIKLVNTIPEIIENEKLAHVIYIGITVRQLYTIAYNNRISE